MRAWANNFSKFRRMDKGNDLDINFLMGIIMEMEKIFIKHGGTC